VSHTFSSHVLHEPSSEVLGVHYLVLPDVLRGITDHRFGYLLACRDLHAYYMTPLGLLS
jgi:hypothetical protein